MNLWVKRLGQLTMLSVALFFLSCQEDVAVLGYKNPNSQFKVFSVEIPLESSVLLRDSLRTSNYHYSGEPNRLLVGKYQDDKFGEITSSAVTQFFTVNGAKLQSDAVFDSVSVNLQFDLYHYGSTLKTGQSLSVYKLDDDINFDNSKSYFNKTTVNASQLLGSKSFTINPADFDKFATSSTDYDTVITVKVPLAYSYGRDIFAAAERYRDGNTVADSMYVRYSDFVKQFKGLVIKPDVADKAVGFTPSGASTLLLLHYHTAKDTLALALSMTGMVSFNQITADRSSTELAQIQQYHQEYLQESDNRYVQAGTGILTKIDFSKFYSFLDTLPNIMISSAELVVENVEANDALPPPRSLVLRNLNPNNRFRKYLQNMPQDSLDVFHYYHNSALSRSFLSYDIATSSGPALVDNDLGLYVSGDKANAISYSAAKRSYSGVFTLLTQLMTIRGDDRTQLKFFVLYPGSDASTTPAFTSGAKGLNRAVFPKSGIKLKLYYTKPLLAQ